MAPRPDGKTATRLPEDTMTMARTETHSSARRPGLLQMLLAGVVATLAVLVLAGPATADWQVESFDGAVLDQNGDPATQAGSHPWTASTAFDITAVTGDNGIEVPTESLRDAKIDLPPGFIGNALAVPTCPEALFNIGRDDRL